MTSAFEQQLKVMRTSAIPNVKALPLTHVTDWAGFLAITGDGRFASKALCPIYGTHLVYAFYGRPAYRFRDDGLSHNVPSYSPVCFLLRPDLAGSSSRILPFDSGGFARYKAAMHPSLHLGSYELAAATESPTDLVGILWETNENYYGSKYVEGLDVDPSMVALLHYYHLISNKLSVVFDNRCSTIEVQFASPLQLNGNVEAVIVPSGVAGDTAIRIAKSLNAELLTYEFEMPYSLNDFHVSVRTVVRDFLQSRGLL
jgi:hypothetical protein